MKKIALLMTSATIIISCAPQTTTQTETNIKEVVSQAQDLFTFGKSNPEVERLQKLAMESSAAYDITESLTTEIGPRLAGSDAEARARDWAMAKMKALGFENVRNEPFTIKGWERGVETASIVSPYPQQLYITSLGGSVATPPEGIESDVVYFPTFKDLDGTDSHRFPHTGQMRYADDVAPIPIAALSAPDADQLERTFKRGDKVRVKVTLTPKDVGELPSGNVIGEIIGSEKPEEIVLVSGHLDSWDLGTGALDDGAGIGISMGAMKVLLDSGLKPKRTLRVVAFGAEEVGLLGGYAYVGGSDKWGA